MKTQIFTVSESSDEKIEIAAAALRRGGLVIFPTETVYGLGADATSADAARSIYAAKGRPSDNPLIIPVSSPEQAEKYAVTNELYYRLAKKFMPGPLTVILPRKDTIPKETAGGLDTVAVRCPSHPIANALIAAAGIPIAAPSANISGKPSPTNAQDVIFDMDGRVDIIIDGGECDIGLESTIVKLDGSKGVLLRPGAITSDALSCVLDELEIAPAVLEKLAENERPLSPGMKYRHYAPDAPLVLLDGDGQSVLNFMKSTPDNALLLCYDEELEALRGKKTLPIGAKDDLKTQAHRLFSSLRQADRENAKIIYAHLPPKEGLGLALYNRMLRAAAHTVKYIKSED